MPWAYAKCRPQPTATKAPVEYLCVEYSGPFGASTLLQFATCARLLKMVCANARSFPDENQLRIIIEVREKRALLWMIFLNGDQLACRA